MADTVSVIDETDFIEAVRDIEDDTLSLNEEAIETLWAVWTARYEQMGLDEYLVVVPEWFSEKEFNRRRPLCFATIEYDDPSSGAILFGDARMIDISIVEGGYWEDVEMSDTVEILDISPEDEYIDEAGKVWIPRSLLTILERP